VLQRVLRQNAGDCLQHRFAQLNLIFPALFSAADESANKWQHSFWRLIRAEYALLFLASVFTMGLSNHGLYHAGYALVLLASLAVLLHRTGRKPEQDWYRSRALAESVKTSTWRYVMRAQPFNGEDLDARKQFRHMLGELLSSNEHIADKLAGYKLDGAQTTPEMEQVRAMDWKARRDLYVTSRIRDQRAWYSAKATQHAASAAFWRRISIGIYVVGVVLALIRISNHDWLPFWPVEPLIVAASAVLGWGQINKFSELASAYTLTALEIGLIEGKLQDLDKESELSDFVNEAELAFSREHTQWVARQTSHV